MAPKGKHSRGLVKEKELDLSNFKMRPFRRKPSKYLFRDKDYTDPTYTTSPKPRPPMPDDTPPPIAKKRQRRGSHK